MLDSNVNFSYAINHNFVLITQILYEIAMVKVLFLEFASDLIYEY